MVNSRRADAAFSRDPGQHDCRQTLCAAPGRGMIAAFGCR